MMVIKTSQFDQTHKAALEEPQAAGPGAEGWTTQHTHTDPWP